MTLRRVAAKEVDVVEGNLMTHMVQVKGLAYMLQYVEEEEMSSSAEPFLGVLQRVLDEFSGVFATPQGLPLSRQCDHRIPLLNPNLAANVRPYRYPFPFSLEE